MKAADLRKSILQAAVQGKLVPQNPHDEPATKLLERIRKEKAQLVKEGKIKKEKPLPPISEEEIPFVLPEGWVWCRFGEVCSKLTDGSHNPPPARSSGYPVISAKNVKMGRVVFTPSDRFTDAAGFLKENPRTNITRGDIVLGIIGGSIGNAGIFEHDTKVIAQRSIAIINTVHINGFVYCFIQSPHVQSLFGKKASGTAQGGIYLGELKHILLPLPPLHEQEVIIAKVNELMNLCDELEAAEKELDTLESQFTDYLPKSILQAAVQGKLVPQNIHDEPADKLLESIRAEKAKLIKNGKLKKEKPLPPITEEEIPYDLPDGWTWCRLGEVALFVTSGSRDWAKYYSSNGALFLRMGNLSKDSFSLRLDSLQHVSPPKDTEGQRTRLEPHDILVSITGDVGNLGYIPEGFGEAYINQHTALVRLPVVLHNLYIPFAFLSKCCKEQFATPQRGIKNSFRLTDLTYMLIPIPPLAEQQRIAAKVNELMTLCDALKAAHEAPVGAPIAAMVIPFPHQEEESEMLMAARGAMPKAPSKALQDARNRLFED